MKIRKSISVMLAIAVVIMSLNIPALGVVTVEEDDGYTTLDTFSIPLSVAVSNTSEKMMPARNVDVELRANISIQQKTGTNRIRTVIEVETVDFWSNVMIESFAGGINYVDCTEFSLPSCYNTVNAVGTAPYANFLKHTTDSVSFISGHDISVAVTISDVQMTNAIWLGEPVSTSRIITIL